MAEFFGSSAMLILTFPQLQRPSTMITENDGAWQRWTCEFEETSV
jgi:hypothetical protein